MQTPIVIIENTPHCPTGLVSLNLPDHTVHRLEASPEDAGFGLIARRRSYFVCLQRQRAHLLFDIQEVYDYFSRAVRVPTSPADALLADPAEVQQEAQRLAVLRHRAYYPGVSGWAHLLTDRERGYLLLYSAKQRQLVQRPVSWDDVYHLGDNPAQRCTWSITSGKIPTYRTASSLMWFAAAQRPMTTKEKLATLGFPVYPALAAMSDYEIMCPTDREARRMLGNAWHLACGSLVVAAALASASLASESAEPCFSASAPAP